MHYRRWMWKARKPKRSPGTLSATQVNSVVLHYPAMSGKLNTVDGVKSALRSWQNYHMDTHGWSDIAYQVAFDQMGNSYRLRGIGNRSAANGNTELNLTKCAFLLVVAENEMPTPKMIKTVNRFIGKARKRYPKISKIQGHGQVRPGGTSCPGRLVQGMIDNGTFR